VPNTTRSTTVFALTGIILLALGIRTGVAAIAPLAPVMDLDVAMEGLPLGIIGTIPPVAYALAAWFSPWLARTVGIESAAIAVAVLGAIAHVWRGISPTYLSLFVATAVLMIAAGVGNVIIPGLVKLYAPRAIGTVTAIYGTAMAISSSAPSFFGVIIADAAGWRLSLASWALVSLVGALPWLLVLPFARQRSRAESALDSGLIPVVVPVSLFRSPTALSVMGIFAVSGTMAYTWFALLPQLLVDEAGFSVEQAAFALGVFTITGFPMSLVIPPLATNARWAGALVGLAVACGLAGMVGLLVAPATATLLWVVLLALGPMTFPLSLTLIGLRTDNHLSALALSGFVNKVGYFIAAVGPLLAGLLLQVTGQWAASVIFLMLVVVCEIPAVWVLARNGNVDRELRAFSDHAHLSK
jgi:CP family cyanate transporter-like MFS transporter